MPTKIVENASGRPNEESYEEISFTDHSVNKNGFVTIGATHKYKTVEKSFSHASVGSPVVFGKLQIRSNPYTMTKIEKSNGIVKVEGSAVGYGGFVSYQYLSLSGGSLPSTYTADRNAAVGRARSKFLQEVANTSANLLLTLVERKEILETVLTLSKGVYKKLVAYRRIAAKYNSSSSDAYKKRLVSNHISGFSARGVSKSKDTLADLWLFYVYGIMPLVLDIKKMIDHIDRPKPRAVHGRGRRSFNSKQPIYDNYFRCDRMYTGYVSAHCRGYVTITDPFKKMLAQYGFTNIALIVWERISYSFVIDWFLNLGSWLSSLSALDGVTVTDYTESVKIKNGYSLSNFQPINSGGWSIRSSLANPDFFMYERKERAVLPTPPKPPIFQEVNLDWRRLLSGISLLNQRFGRLK